MTDFQTIYVKLKNILSAYGRELVVKYDTDSNYYVDTHKIYNKKPVFFGAVQIKKNYVSFHFMPLYTNPELVQGIFPGLKKRMQGKACFNFKQEDDKLFTELEELVRKGYEVYKQGGWV